MAKNKRKPSADDSFLLEYRERIESGEIIAGMELRMELDNLAEDLKNDEYYYDRKDALLRMNFIENCIRLTKSPFYGQPMELMLWQKAFIEALYSFKMSRDLKDRGKVIDRFKKALLLIARKNGKSETLSALANSEFITGMSGADIVCSSNDDSQASIAYDAIDAMRRLYDPKDTDTKKNQRFILNKVNNTRVWKISEKTQNKEGRNIDFAIQDEAHELKGNNIPKAIEQSQSVKENPKFLIITTEGFIVDGYLDAELKVARAIINREDDSVSAARILPWLYTQDSEMEIFTNPRSWYKSNPSLGKIKKISYLEEQVDLAKKSKADRIYVLSKDFNIKQNAVEAWLNIEDYTYDAKYNLEDLRGSYCLGHVDLAETTDLACAMALILLPDLKTKIIISRYFIPESKLEPDKDDHLAGAKYKEWAKAGYIDISEGNEVDLSKIATFFYELKKDYNITLYKCGYDQRFAKTWIQAMEEYGWTVKFGELEMVLQNADTLHSATMLVESELKARHINYNENPVDRWCFSNTCLQVNNRMQALCIKTEKAKKIDGAVTLVSLFEMYRRYKNDMIRLAGGNR